MQRCAPTDAQGVDPSEAQLAFARSRPEARGATFQIGDALALPFPGNHFDAAVMALVIFFVPEPAKGVAEMARRWKITRSSPTAVIAMISAAMINVPQAAPGMTFAPFAQSALDGVASRAAWRPSPRT